jgi:DNA-binding NtrC family response regulator
VNSSILIVEDDQDLAETLGRLLTGEGFGLAIVHTAASAIEHLKHHGADLVLLDLRLPDANGLDVLREVRDLPDPPGVIVMTAYASIRSAVLATQLGAVDYLTKPVDQDELLLSVRNAEGRRALHDEVVLLRDRQKSAIASEKIVQPRSEQMRRTVDQARLASRSDTTTVLITGESGVGKEYLARMIHEISQRRNGPFIDLNCAAVPETLAESELFGHEAGAFTGARARRRGVLELSDRGTLFLDEISEMSPALQARLLRFLETRTFRRVGGSHDVVVDSRIIAATNVDLKEAVQSGIFREDLYYRLQVFPIHVPPLRCRQEDIPLLTEQLITWLRRSTSLRAARLSSSAECCLLQYSWPGNVRELRNVLERAIILAGGDEIAPEHLGISQHVGTGAEVRHEEQPRSLPEAIDDLTLRSIESALAECDGVQTEAARRLGITRHTLAYQMRRLRVVAQESASPSPSSDSAHAPSDN